MVLRRFLIIFLALILAACNINVNLPNNPVQQQAVGTVVALTMQAAAPLASPAAPTPTYSKPILAITGDSNCRSGPGGSYKVVTAFTPGTSLDIVGKDTADNYWQVTIPNSQDTCWVWGKYATASGSYNSLPESGQSAASGGAGVPNRPGSLFYTYTCPFGNLTTNLTWSDSADNETGYHVYRFDILLAELPANSTSYTETVTVTPGSDLQYSVAAYNSAGESAKRTVSFKCQ